MSQPAHYACIDVGTNTVKMVIADLANGGTVRVFEQSNNTRLGEGMQAQAMRLREVPMRRTLDAIVEFARIAKEHHVVAPVAVGTAALRDADNSAEIVERVEAACGIKIQVIPGEEEARLSYLAVRRDPRWRDEPQLIVLDIGGGSTEVIHGDPNSDGIAARISLNVGAVKLTERFLRSDPPTITQLSDANRFVQEEYARVENYPETPLPPTFVGVGGTVTNLGAMENGRTLAPEELHGYTLSQDALENQIARLSVLTVEQRKELPGLDPRRADIILGGAILLSQALARAGSTEVAVSTRGLRWGVLYDRFLKGSSQ
jgi:exopolyphosphatase / guanosine-5'-triphosphate,3'-diphosphate pyrophosphatase